ncbi:DUF5361 domain-containing protein [Mycobacterium sp. CnD-18-1]|uniref:DUF5361 domain-containing protein n=1 Tax=Mycobacterium sp. CnD-18-1 TaxID=2917744 RepID=UPI001EF1D599|nr:DUF5361 domain-containing protein [Mycobacterium sp. CnD-18-1]MCG7607085.1 DUF5361 domain-containing protein [Mycobacterium sp. CnD-18-1]
MKFLGRDSNLVRTMDPEKADWTLGNRLLAIIANSLRILIWFKTKDGQKGRNRPVMIGPDMSTPQREGSRVPAAPLSAIKAKFARDNDKSRQVGLRKLFGR